MSGTIEKCHTCWKWKTRSASLATLILFGKIPFHEICGCCKFCQTKIILDPDRYDRDNNCRGDGGNIITILTPEQRAARVISVNKDVSTYKGWLCQGCRTHFGTTPR